MTVSNAALVINAGSSSVKFALFLAQEHAPILYGIASGLQSDTAQLTYHYQGHAYTEPLAPSSHSFAVASLITILNKLNLFDRIRVAGHRVVHGGAGSAHPKLIDQQLKENIQRNGEFAPLHNPVNLLGINAIEDHAPTMTQVAVFDTAFHTTLPEIAYRYAIPEQWHTELGIRRFGFHGINHHFIALTCTPLMAQLERPMQMVSAHLGNGCSVCAIKDGNSVDTSMGFTPLEGLVMGTRCGDIDPGLMEYLCEKLNVTIQALTKKLNSESGLKGVSGLTHDMQQLQQAAESGHQDAQLAIELFCYRLAKSIASYTVPLGTIEALVFTGGIGEHSAIVRQKTVGWLKGLSFHIDPALNARDEKGVRNIASKNSPPIFVVPANEELMIAQQSFELLEKQGTRT